MSDPTDTPPRLCAWCGGGPVPPSRGTKPRAYCSRSCVQRAYEARKERERTKERIVAAYMKGRREEAELSAGKSRDVAGGKSRDFSELQVTPPGAEPCPYCGVPVVGLVAHLRQCPQGPGTAGEPDGRPRRDPHG